MAVSVETAPEPDPRAALPAGTRLQLGPRQARAPINRGEWRLQALTRGGEPKPLRPPKGPIPRARRIDTDRQLNRGGTTAPQVVGLSAAPAAALGAATAAPAVVVTTFEGGIDDSTTIPPDTHAAFSRTHAINPHNNNIHFVDLANLHAAPTVVALDIFWSVQHCFDPKVVYDPNVDRFYFVTMAGAASNRSALLIGVSASGDPTQPWQMQTVAVDPAAQGPVWMDYPSLGFSADKVTVQVNLFTIAGNAFNGSTIYVFDKAALLNPGAAAVLQRFVVLDQGAGQAPAATLDAAMNDQYLVSSWTGNDGSGKGALAVWLLSGSAAAGTVALTRVGFVNGTGAWDSFPPAGEFGPQSGIADRLDVGDDRMLTVIYRDGKLHCCHTVMLPAGGATRAAVQWWEMPVNTWSATVGMLDDSAANVFYAYPSLAVNMQGDKLIGHAQFSAAAHPSGAYLLLLADGSRAAAVFAAGQNTYVKRFGGAKNRWGDYSATQIDPRDDHSFFTVQEYASAKDTWATRVAHVTTIAGQV